MKAMLVLLRVSIILVLPALASAQENAAQHPRYRLVDLGTFGGPQGYINPWGNGGPYINQTGAVVGQTQTTVPIPANADTFLCYPGPGINHAFVWQHGHTIDLGSLPPSDDNCSDALGINARDEIAGQASNGIFDPLLGVIELRAVIWRNGRIEDLGTLGGNESLASSINDRGQVTGIALNGIPDPYSIFGRFYFGSTNSTQTRAFLWQDGVMHDLGTLGGPDSFALPGLINRRGELVGSSYTNSIPNAITTLPTLDPFLWDGTRMIDLGSLGGHFSIPLGLNNNGQVIGISNTEGDTFSHPFFWSDGHMKDLGTFGGNSGEANALNDKGEVVGDANLPGDAIRHAFLWQGGNKQDLGVLPGTKCSSAYAINSHSQIVGGSGQCGFGGRAFLWEKGQMFNLNDLVWPKFDVVLTEPNVIGDDGRIGVNGLPPGCNNGDVCGHPYLLIPIPEQDAEAPEQLREQ
jgi:probable HAF family extracellular repeat protein